MGVAVGCALLVACSMARPSGEAVPNATASEGSSKSPASTPSASRSAPPSPSTTPGSVVANVVPVVDRWTADPRLTSADVIAALEGNRSRFDRVLVRPGLLGPLDAALGIEAAADVSEADIGEMTTAVDGAPTSLGLLLEGDVGPGVLAAELDGQARFGVERVANRTVWPLRIAMPAGTVGDDPARWTLAVGGDVMLDRSIYRRSILDGLGVDEPWSGGTAVLDGTTCCSAAGLPLPDAHADGHAGAFGSLLRDADLALVNLEGPVPNKPTYHPHGLVFNFDPRLLAGLADAGIDVVGLANNHVGDAGASGVVETLANLDAVGLRHVGAGPDRASAAEPLLLDTPGGRLAVLAYDERRPEYWAGSGPGTNGFDIDRAVEDVRAAAGHGDIVLVFLHWGEEYRLEPFAWQRDDAHRLTEAGATLVLGSHPHVTGALEVIGGTVVDYSLGNLVFDLTRSEATMEGVVLEITFDGDRVVQARPRPTVILDLSQPNLLEPDDGAAVVLDRMRTAGAAP